MQTNPSGAELLNGRTLADDVLRGVATDSAAYAEATGHAPGLAIVRVGEDPASKSYARAIERCCARAGIEPRPVTMPGDTPAARLADVLDALREDALVAGIIVQFPLRAALREIVRSHIPPEKDVDGIHPLNAGLLALGDPAALVPATPLGGMVLLRANGVPLTGARAVVIGRSPVVGRPLAQLLLQADATVTICHTRTRDLAAIASEAEILAVAAGRPHMITADMIQPGATVLDFGVNYVGGQMVGDVDTEGAMAVAGRITPVPGGTGPMTNAMLMRNSLQAARALLSRA